MHKTLDRITDIVFALDNEWNFAYINKAAEFFFNIPVELLIGKQIWVECASIITHAFHQACYNAMNTQQHVVIEDNFSTKNNCYQINIYPSADGVSVIFYNNTEQNITHQKLIKTKNRFKALVENNEGIISLIDENLNMLYRNPAAATITGWTNEEYEKMNGMDNIHPDDANYLAMAIQDAVTKPQIPINVLFRVKCKNQNYIWLEGVITNQLNDENIRGILSNLKDVTKRLDAEKKIKKSEERFAFAAKATNDMIWDWNLITDEILWNENYNTMFGYGPHTINSWVSKIYDEDRERVKKSIYDVVNLGQNFWSNEYRYLGNNNDVMYVYDRGYVDYDEFGKPYRMIGSMQNITERILAEQAIKNSEEKYRTLVEQASDAIYITDQQGKFITVNTSACELSGYSETELMQMNIYDFLFIEDLEKTPLRFDELRNGKAVIIERRFKIKNDAILHVECVAKMLSNGKILVFARDISERKKAQEELKKSTEDIRRLATHLTQIRDEERKRIGREIHDELGQQLTAIKMDMAWLSKKINVGDDVVKNKLQNIISLLDGGNQSVRKILSELSPAVLDNYGLLEALQMQNRKFTSSSNINIDFFTSQTHIELAQETANCIFRVYQESLTNILRYANATQVSASLKIMNQFITLIIEDNGEGFDEKLEKNNKSFGILGMRERVLSLGGIFTLQSKLKQGTKITINLPYLI